METRKLKGEGPISPLRSMGSVSLDTDEELAKNTDTIDKNAVSKVIRTTSVRSGTTEEELSLYITPPVKGFEITPSLIWRSNSGSTE